MVPYRSGRILRGALVARQGVLRKIGYTQDLKYRTVTGSRFLLEVPGKHGKMIHEVYIGGMSIPPLFLSLPLFPAGIPFLDKQKILYRLTAP